MLHLSAATPKRGPMRHRALTITTPIVVGAIVLQLNSLAMTQGSLEPLDDPESYAVYRALLPTQWAVRVVRAQTLVFQKETTTYSACTPSGTPLETAWRSVVESFKAENAKARIVLPGYDLGLPYVVVASADIRATFNAVPNDPMFGWSGFYKEYPDSGGFMQVSAVGFDD